MKQSDSWPYKNEIQQELENTRQLLLLILQLYIKYTLILIYNKYIRSIVCFFLYRRTTTTTNENKNKAWQNESCILKLLSIYLKTIYLCLLFDYLHSDMYVLVYYWLLSITRNQETNKENNKNKYKKYQIGTQFYSPAYENNPESKYNINTREHN